MAITMKQVAAQAGVSLPTASLILSGRGAAYQAATRERVLAAAADLGYRRNAAAQAISRGRFAAIALLQDINVARSETSPDLIAGIVDRGQEVGLHLTVGHFDDEQLSDAGFLPRLLSQVTADGLLLNYHTDMPPAMVELIRRHHIPAISLNRDDPGDCIQVDELAAGQRAVRELVQRGHRRILYADPHFESGHDFIHYSRRDRHRGYVEGMQAAGLPVILGTTRAADDARPYSIWYAERIRRHQATAVIVQHSVYCAVLAVHLLGLKPQRDVAVLGIGSGPSYLDEWIPMIFPDWSALGAAAVDELQEKIRAPTVMRPARKVAAMVLVDRLGSAAPP